MILTLVAVLAWYCAVALAVAGVMRVAAADRAQAVVLGLTFQLLPASRSSLARAFRA